MRTIDKTNLALVFADCCQASRMEQQMQSNLGSNCTMYPEEPSKDLGSTIISEDFNGDKNGLLLEGYFKDKINAKG